MFWKIYRNCRSASQVNIAYDFIPLTLNIHRLTANLPSEFTNWKSLRNCLHILRGRFPLQNQAVHPYPNANTRLSVSYPHHSIISSLPSRNHAHTHTHRHHPHEHIITFNPDASVGGSPNWQSTWDSHGAAYWKWFPANRLAGVKCTAGKPGGLGENEWMPRLIPGIYLDILWFLGFCHRHWFGWN